MPASRSNSRAGADRPSDLTPSLRHDTGQIIVRFIKDYVEEAGAEGAAIGLSGGLDSAVVAALAVHALGDERVLGVHMPLEALEDADYRDARALATALGIDLRVMPIGEAVRAIATIAGGEDKGGMGNIQARTRMIILYHIAREQHRLVLGTGNKSELLTGYFTKWGDGGTDLLPIGDLYKTQVRALARVLKIPSSIVEKVPSAGLWPGQTDEGELGISYEMLDRILLGIELGLDDAAISERARASISDVKRVRGMVRRSVHKRRMPLVPKMAVRTVGSDWRE
ncbi:MAG: NAD+ synthase [Candidatus Thermoplasmatota archaeon]